MLLEVSNATVHYHKVAALRGVSMDVPDGSVVTIIGANGAGKSTLLRAISGLVDLSEGEIRFDGRRIDGTPPEKVVALGRRPGARGAADLSRAHGPGEPQHRGVSPPRPRGGGAGSGRRVRPLSEAQGAAATVGQDPLGRGAADARHRARPDVEPEGPPSRRTDDRALAGARDGDGPHHPRDPRAGGAGGPRGAECGARAPARRLRLRAGDRLGRPAPDRPRTSTRTSTCAAPTSAPDPAPRANGPGRARAGAVRRPRRSAGSRPPLGRGRA